MAPLSDVEWRDFLEIRRLFLTRACVQGMFSTADGKLATERYQRHLPLQRIEHAYLLGCARIDGPLREENDPDA